ncbi:MAG: phage terminase large subunit [Holosporales bacterium]|jgi:predicted phage terminase large subunit-like protein|nr:phage terminase large subunit [Holosporales bacterium]
MVTNCNKENPNSYDWDSIARDSQKIPEGDWMLWLITAGRGFGKTRTGAESIMKFVNEGKYKNIAIIGKTLGEARSIMVEGPSGILSTSISYTMDMKYYPAKKEIIWGNGAKATLIGGDNVDSLRGHQFDLVWVDEFAKFKRPKALWEQIMFTLRIGNKPKCIMTTTPRPIKILKDLLSSKYTHVTKGSTFENAHNLSAHFVEFMKATYVNTRIGDQELMGEIVVDDNGALWRDEDILYKEASRPDMQRVVIGVDPAMSNGENSDETGIIVAGLGEDEKVYILDDLSGKYTPPEWAKVVARAYHDYQAERVVGEVNNGGDLVESMIKTFSKFIPFSPVRAIKGKVARAEPIALMYESSNVYHVRRFEELEKQMRKMSRVTEDGETGKAGDQEHDDRVDALVWAVSEIKNKKFNRVSIDFI